MKNTMKGSVKKEKIQNSHIFIYFPSFTEFSLLPRMLLVSPQKCDHILNSFPFSLFQGVEQGIGEITKNSGVFLSLYPKIKAYRGNSSQKDNQKEYLTASINC